MLIKLERLTDRHIITATQIQLSATLLSRFLQAAVIIAAVTAHLLLPGAIHLLPVPVHQEVVVVLVAHQAVVVEQVVQAGAIKL
jgi:hypothetical protein